MSTLLDSLKRPLHSLRISVTDRCNLRCAYCMPEANYTWLESRELLGFEELSRLVDRFIALGVTRVRLTGGEPLLRRQLEVLISLLAGKPELDEVALTTNGVLLADRIQALKDAGLARVTISLDTLDRARFRQLTRQDDLPRVLEGIAAARRVLGAGLKLDTVLMRGVNDHEVPALLRFAAGAGAELRLIEYMDVGGATQWDERLVVSRAEVLAQLNQAVGPVTALPGQGSAPAERFRLPSGQTFGIIASTTQPFCQACDRTRLTADGHLFTCLYATQGLDLKAPLRGGADDAAIEQLIATTWKRRSDRGAEDRLALLGSRGPLATASELRLAPHREMHTRGG